MKLSTLISLLQTVQEGQENDPDVVMVVYTKKDNNTLDTKAYDTMFVGTNVYHDVVITNF